MMNEITDEEYRQELEIILSVDFDVMDLGTTPGSAKRTKKS